MAEGTVVKLAGLETPDVCACCLRDGPEGTLRAPMASMRVAVASIPICKDCASVMPRFLRTMNLVTLAALLVSAAVVLLVYEPARHPFPLTPPVTFAYLGAMGGALVVGAAAYVVLRGRPPYRREGHVPQCRPVRFLDGESAELKNPAFAARCTRRDA